MLEIRDIPIKDVYSFFQYGKKLDNNIYYMQNNWLKRVFSSVGYYFAISKKNNIIDKNGASIWLTSDGDICYRFSMNGKIHRATIPKINMVFSSFLNCNFSITLKIPRA